ncbi:hypothetical protein PROFUN_11917 [Planoprotostelium fungivorum]|uniref:Uncharacterized protein n=1 Tax=Planoprotostelium fungivorum TaxID=1890364 RepID=A0A2P6N8R6_9EUKA|nr:hypothetical protein PROFUN_11917 [Planoprotostelium fungivorum]
MEEQSLSRRTQICSCLASAIIPRSYFRRKELGTSDLPEILSWSLSKSSNMRRVLLLLVTLFALVQSQCAFVDQKNLTQAAAGVSEVRVALPPVLSQYLSQNDFEITYQRAETDSITFELNLLEGFGRYTVSSSVISNGVVQLSVANVGSTTATESTFALVVSPSSDLRPNGFVSLALVILLAALRAERKLAFFLILSLVVSVQAKDACQSHANIILPLSVQTLCVDGINFGDIHDLIFDHFRDFIYFGRNTDNITIGCHIIYIFGIINYLRTHICYYLCAGFNHLCSDTVDCLCGHNLICSDNLCGHNLICSDNLCRHNLICSDNLCRHNLIGSDIIDCLLSTWSSTLSSTFSPSITTSSFINCTEGTVLVEGSCLYIDACGVPGGDNSTCNRFSVADFCEATAPYRCPDGSCSSSLSLCVVLCPAGQVRCCDGSCGNTTRDCVQSSYNYLTVQEDAIITCPDGLCQSDPNACLCDNALYKCYDGSCQIDCSIVPVSLVDLKVTTNGGTYAMLRSDTLATGAQVTVSNLAGNISIVVTTITPADEVIGKRLIGINLLSPIVRIQGYASDHSHLYSFPSPISFNFSDVPTVADVAICHALLTSEGTIECLDNKTRTFSLSGPSIVTTISGVYGSRGICWYRDACGVCNGAGACNLPYGNICTDGSYCFSGICITANITTNTTVIVQSSNPTVDYGTCGCDVSSCPAGYKCGTTSTCQCVVDRCGVCGGLDDCYAKGGEACTNSTDCASGVCQSSRCGCDNIHGCSIHQYCRNNTCVCDGQLDKCGVCNGNGTTCGRPIGADCSKDSNCFSGLCLRGVCSCSDSSQCPDPQICTINATCICFNSTVDNCGVCGGNNGSCNQLPGAPCNEDANCLYGLCSNQTCLCTSDDDCGATEPGWQCLSDGQCQCPWHDSCDVCRGDNSTCVDCTNTPWGIKTYDSCGICGGHGDTCVTSPTPSHCSLASPYVCPNSSCAAHPSDCYAVPCPTGQMQCYTGDCVNDARTCPDFVAVAADPCGHQWAGLCLNDVCVNDLNECLCNDTMGELGLLCADGSCQTGCPLHPREERVFPMSVGWTTGASQSLQLYSAYGMKSLGELTLPTSWTKQPLSLILIVSPVPGYSTILNPYVFPGSPSIYISAYKIWNVTHSTRYNDFSLSPLTMDLPYSHPPSLNGSNTMEVLLFPPATNLSSISEYTIITKNDTSTVSVNMTRTEAIMVGFGSDNPSVLRTKAVTAVQKRKRGIGARILQLRANKSFMSVLNAVQEMKGNFDDVNDPIKYLNTLTDSWKEHNMSNSLNQTKDFLWSIGGEILSEAIEKGLEKGVETYLKKSGAQSIKKLVGTAGANSGVVTDIIIGVGKSIYKLAKGAADDFKCEKPYEEWSWKRMECWGLGSDCGQTVAGFELPIVPEFTCPQFPTKYTNVWCMPERGFLGMLSWKCKDCGTDNGALAAARNLAIFAGSSALENVIPGLRLWPQLNPIDLAIKVLDGKYCRRASECGPTATVECDDGEICPENAAPDASCVKLPLTPWEYGCTKDSHCAKNRADEPARYQPRCTLDNQCVPPFDVRPPNPYQNCGLSSFGDLFTCPTDQYCVYGVCSPPLPLGARCDSNDWCLSKKCDWISSKCTNSSIEYLNRTDCIPTVVNKKTDAFSRWLSSYVAIDGTRLLYNTLIPISTQGKLCPDKTICWHNFSLAYTSLSDGVIPSLGVCRIAELAGKGESACVNGTLDCYSGYCDSTTLKCYELAIGESCNNDLSCLTRYCDPKSNQCAACPWVTYSKIFYDSSVQRPVPHRCTPPATRLYSYLEIPGGPEVKCNSTYFYPSCDVLTQDCHDAKCMPYTGIQVGALCLKHLQCKLGFCFNGTCSSYVQSCQYQSGGSSPCINGVCSSSGQCLPQCNFNSQCNQNSFCNYRGKCETLLPLGAECFNGYTDDYSMHQICRSGFCFNGQCSQKTAIEIPSIASNWKEACHSGSYRSLEQPGLFDDIFPKLYTSGFCKEDDAHRCSIDADCLNGNCKNGTCVGTCQYASECPAGQQCINGGCSLWLNTGRFLGGENCTTNSQCLSNLCDGRICGCNSNFHCSRYQTCNMDTAHCDTKYPRSQSPAEIADGLPCMSKGSYRTEPNLVCKSGICINNICRANRTVCYDDSECYTQHCEGFQCKPTPLGSRCVSGDQCLSGICQNGACISGSGNDLSFGDKCSHADDCISRSCVGGACGRMLGNHDYRAEYNWYYQGDVNLTFGYTAKLESRGFIDCTRAPCGDGMYCSIVPNVRIYCATRINTGSMCDITLPQSCRSEACRNGLCYSRRASCQSDANCNSGQICLNSECFKTADMICSQDSDCISASCNNGKCTKAPVGRRCATSIECQTSSCILSTCQYATANQTCTSQTDCLSWQSYLATYKSTPAPPACERGSCSPSDTVMACQEHSECYSSKCESINGYKVCRPSTTGAPCRKDSDCGTKSCVDGICAASVLSGACTYDTDCGSKRCYISKTQYPPSGICVGGVPGDSCLSPTDCGSRNCSSSGICVSNYNGGPCKIALDCNSNICKPYNCTFGSCNYLCGAGPPGADCTDDSQCFTQTCINSSICSWRSIGMTCTSPNQCSSATCSAGKCSLNHRSTFVNDWNNFSYQCITSADCGSGKCDTLRMCQMSGPGENCTLGADCSTSSCIQGKCSLNRGGQSCTSGGDCSSQVCSKGTCQSGVILGYCTYDEDCFSGNCGNNACQPGKIGATCQSGYGCLSGSCYMGICRAAPVGSTCQIDTDCSSFSCSGGRCIESYTNCTGNQDCYSRVCHDSVCQPGSTGTTCRVDPQCNTFRCGSGVCQMSPPGGVCTVNSDCGTLCVNGACALSSAGGICTANVDCGSGSCVTTGNPPYCSRSGAGSQCATRADCTTKKCISSVCGKGFMGDSCRDYGDCLYGQCFNQTCQGFSVGSICSVDLDCKSNFCFQGKCSPFLFGAGSPCNTSDTCWTKTCTNGICQASGYIDQCGTSSDCTTKNCTNYRCGRSAAYGPCSTSPDCSTGSCNGTHCLPSNAGGVCYANTDCSTGSCGGDRRCQTSAMGGPCLIYNDCVSRNCVNQICSPAGYSTQCTINTDCVSQNCQCVVSGCTTKMCSPGPAGSSCYTKDDCSTNRCVNGTCAKSPAGGSCTINLDCITGACASKTCQKSNSGGPCTVNNDCNSATANVCYQGSCAYIPQPAGSSCYDNSGCTTKVCTNNVCQKNTYGYPATCVTNIDCTTSNCTDGMCQRAYAGMTCSINSDCYTRTCTNGMCQKSGYRGQCSLATDCTTNVCTGSCELSKVGSPCSFNTDCSSNTCNGTTCVPASQGAACKSDPDCLSRICMTTCTVSHGGDACFKNSDCSNSNCQNNLCVMGGYGDYCTDDLDCVSNKCGTNGTCAANIPNSGCFNASDCTTAVCKGGVCQSLPPGADCTDNSDCSESFCKNTYNKCVYHYAGQSCENNSWCSTNICTGGVCQVTGAGGPCQQDDDCTGNCNYFTYTCY